jgi:hypothetical protein
LHNDLDFEYNQNKPNAIIFDKTYKGKFAKYGAANLTKPEQRIYIPSHYRQRCSTSILIGNANPKYTPMSAIAPYLKACFNY